ncbi:glycosyltransferase [Azospirillum aestuarii]|uniref:glycosyltransferase n=1 Tax=Azospirillum aestuarii TaxID=2802052 RepID=UPI0040550ACA
MKAFFCVNNDALGWFNDMIKVLTQSILETTSLEPVMLFDGNPDHPLVHWVKNRNVEVINTRVPFHRELFSEKTISANTGTPYNPEHASGSFLKFISHNFTNDDFYLQVDCDVMFLKDIEFTLSQDKTLGACQELDLSNVKSKLISRSSHFNAGVMLINRKNFARSYNELIEYCREHNFYHRKTYSYDQTFLNEFFEDSWEIMPRELNWRPVDGVNCDARIVHFHGPKPQRFKDIVDGKAYDFERPLMEDMVLNFEESYRYYVACFSDYLKRSESNIT